MRSAWFQKLWQFLLLGLFISSASCDGLKEEKASSEAVDEKEEAVDEKEEEKKTTEAPADVVEKKVEVIDPVEEPVEIIYDKLTPDDQIVSFASASDADKKDIEDCLFNLDSSFNLSDSSLEFRRVEFEKITGTLAIALEDTKPTAAPQIVLIRALETIGSNLVFKLMNPNGFYCFKNLDAVGTDLNIQLHCEAQLSETIKWTDEKWKTADQTLEDAFVYLSSSKLKKLVHERPEGANCIENRE